MGRDSSNRVLFYARWEGVQGAHRIQIIAMLRTSFIGSNVGVIEDTARGRGNYFPDIPFTTPADNTMADAVITETIWDENRTITVNQPSMPGPPVVNSTRADRCFITVPASRLGGLVIIQNNSLMDVILTTDQQFARAPARNGGRNTHRAARTRWVEVPSLQRHVGVITNPRGVEQIALIPLLTARSFLVESPLPAANATLTGPATLATWSAWTEIARTPDLVAGQEGLVHVNAGTFFDITGGLNLTRGNNRVIVQLELLQGAIRIAEGQTYLRVLNSGTPDDFDRATTDGSMQLQHKGTAAVGDAFVLRARMIMQDQTDGAKTVSFRRLLTYVQVSAI